MGNLNNWGMRSFWSGGATDSLVIVVVFARADYSRIFIFLSSEKVRQCTCDVAAITEEKSRRRILNQEGLCNSKPIKHWHGRGMTSSALPSKLPSPPIFLISVATLCSVTLDRTQDSLWMLLLPQTSVPVSHQVKPIPFSKEVSHLSHPSFSIPTLLIEALPPFIPVIA